MGANSSSIWNIRQTSIDLDSNNRKTTHNFQLLISKRLSVRSQAAQQSTTSSLTSFFIRTSLENLISSHHFTPHTSENQLLISPTLCKKKLSELIKLKPNPITRPNDPRKVNESSLPSIEDNIVISFVLQEWACSRRGSVDFSSKRWLDWWSCLIFNSFPEKRLLMREREKQLVGERCLNY